MDAFTLFSRFGLALAIGLLFGLQREYAKREGELFAGVRTFALVSLLGAATAQLTSSIDSPWPLVAALAVLGGWVGLAYAFGARAGHPGLTSEVATLLVFVVGALCQRGELSLAAALGVVGAGLLALKLELRRLVARLSREDILSTLKFAAITAIVLPLLPAQGLGTPPWDVLSPRNVWLMVVFISGIGFAGYLLVRLVGPQRGIGLTGLLGGMVSSTAVTLGFTGRSRTAPELSRALALGIALSWTVMFGRVLIEAAVVNPQLLARLWPPVFGAGLAGTASSLWLARTKPDARSEMKFSTPFELSPAVKFGFLYAVILVGARAAQLYLGNTGVYLASTLSGVADVDAITLSLARLSTTGDTPLGVAARAVVLASLANTAVKGGMVLVLGAPALRRTLLPSLLAMLAVGLGLAFLV